MTQKYKLKTGIGRMDHETYSKLEYVLGFLWLMEMFSILTVPMSVSWLRYRITFGKMLPWMETG